MADIFPRTEYKFALPFITAVRDAIEGQPAVKAKQYLYLPHPSELDRNSERARIRYSQYLAGAEFDEFPGQTLAATLGKLNLSSTIINLPDRIDYLDSDVDGDGTDMAQQMEIAAAEVDQVKWCILAAEYQGLQGVDISSLSAADVAQINPRSTVKLYKRESVVDWQFERVNGQMQIVYLALKQDGTRFDPATRERVDVESTLVLALDEEGRYYQQKIVDGQEGEREYPTVNGSALQWLPIHVMCDEPIIDHLPRALGALSPIVNLAYDRYRASADYKEAMRMLPPTTFTSGWQSGHIDLFRESNGGRENIETGAGAVNNLPEGVTVSMESANLELGGYERYLEANEKKVRALGGVFRTEESGNRTATEARSDENNRVARLGVLADALEAGYERMALYCGMFEGLWQPAAIENNLDQIVIDVPRDFASAKLSPEEVDRVIQLYLNQLMSRSQAVNNLIRGGWHEGDAEQVIAEIEAGAAFSLAQLDETPVVPAQQQGAVPNE